METINNQREISVLCIANYAADSSMLRRSIASQGDLIEGSFLNPFYYTLGDTRGAVVLINSSNKDLLTTKGRKLAKEQFIKALDYMTVENKKIVVLLAAGLKRLFGKYLEDRVEMFVENNQTKKTLKEMYPNVLFTNGDNGTSYLFNEEIVEIIKKAGISRNVGKIGVLGAGLLGTDVLKFLMSQDFEDYQINVISSYSNDLRLILDGKRDINIFDTIEDVDNNIDFMICCSNSKLLTAETVDSLGIRYVLDVSVPSAFAEDEYFKTKNVYRQDAGNSYNTNLEYNFDPSIIDLSEHNMFGCFSEATSLAHNFSDKLFELDLFTVNDNSREVISALFKKAGFTTHPNPLCFGREI